MAKIISTLSDAISYINTLYESDSTAPSSGDEDYTVWTALLNVAVNVWETEEGVLWKELFTKLSSASDGTKITSASTYSYSCPTDFRYPASGYIWLGSGTTKTAYKVIKIEDVQIYENDTTAWCYFLNDSTPTLEFNPNLTITGGDTISYNYYKFATKLSSGTDKFEMSDPLFAVYYVLSSLKSDEGDVSSGAIATQKLEAMKTINAMSTWNESDALTNKAENGFGV